MMIVPLLVSLTGCQAAIYGTASDFMDIDIGMSESQVMEVLGSPVSKSVNPDTGLMTLEYKKMRHAISDWARMYQVTFKDGKVIGYGEKNTEQDINIY
ncbi:outer membrane protein assembly factor BamE [Vibrio europaeus]|nr:outer membrane protein assembly factor BamE [Vibrio europaeus]MDC5758547.1 outer membrane protein assembly factor BamE [Vibrio europaeus]MDC5777594.1 outer membrane protein assembly factor BamE [Vibrio europaeus]MDC5796540.1 outer membrane protein assembly factor BamE [Vibrio europaeus]MDC5801390.1 outer membrane protein assembly factor BamE [Vibrio europaeus]MDC5813674.1 outer membrane protein assembly factor BamE [Vibrio europaeus]